MPNFSVGIAILLDHKILLTQREDFEIWCLPGGAVENGESLAQAAVREVKEETGLDVQIDRLVGTYSMPQGPNSGTHEIIFAGHPTGGSLLPDPHEVIAAAWFDFDHLPGPVAPWTVQQLQDTLCGVGGSAVWRQDYLWPFPPDMRRRDLYHLRDESGLSRADFFCRYFPQGSFPQIDELKEA